MAAGRIGMASGPNPGSWNRFQPRSKDSLAQPLSDLDGPVPWYRMGKVFVTDVQLETRPAQERVHCFDEATGKSLWTYAYEAEYPDLYARESIATGRHADCRGRQAVHDWRQWTCSLSRGGRPASWLGKRNWTRNLKFSRRAADPRRLIEGDLLILLTGGKPGACVIALEKNSGNLVWRALDESVSNSSPIVITAGGKRQLIVWTGESVTSLVPTTGEVNWREPLVTNTNYSTATPVSEKNCASDQRLHVGAACR